jgi:uncharacterized protein (TIGR02246 family)
MKNYFWGVGLVALLAFSGCGSDSVNPPGSPSASATLDLSAESARVLMDGFSNSFSAAWSDGSPEGVADMFTDDGVRIVGNAQVSFNGKDEIAASFAEIATGGALQQTHVDITTTDARFVAEDLVIGCGTWRIMNTSDEVVMDGKWGNTYRLANGELRMLMESAYQSATDVDEEANVAVVQEMQADWDCGDSETCAQVEANVAAFVSNFNTNNLENISMLFRADGIRTVSALPEIALDRAGVLKSLQGEEGGALSAELKGFKDLGNNLVLAHGQWNTDDSEGEVVAFGQWGNLFETSESGALLVMESAGRFLID